MSSIHDHFATYDITLSPEQAGLFEVFLEAFVAYNSHTNLSAIREHDDIIMKHFLDSLQASDMIRSHTDTIQ